MGMLSKLRALTPDRAPPDVSLAEWVGHTEKRPAPVAGLASRSNRPPVEFTKELARVIALPRRPVVDLSRTAGAYGSTAQALILLGAEQLSRGKRSCACASRGRPCITELMPAQAWALHEAPIVGGLLAPIGVGHGKTGLNILTPMVMPDCKQAVLFIPPGLLEQFVSAYYQWAEHWKVPSLMTPDGKGSCILPGRPVLHVVPYSKFSRQESTDLLTRRLLPDLILADEVHRFQCRDTATTGRLLSYFADQPSTRFCGWSGTITKKTIKDYAHLLAIALRYSSPLPLDPAEVDVWAGALDPKPNPIPPGALRRLVGPGETLYDGFRRRLVQTRGVVTTKAGAIDASIVINERHPPTLPPKLAEMLLDLRENWRRPDGEEHADPLAVNMTARQLACGFFYRRKFPPRKGVPQKVETIEAWFAARKEWKRELRYKLKSHEEHCDSPLLAANAAIRAYQETPYRGELPVWRADYWPAWAAIKGEVYYEKEAVWVDDYLAADAAAWGLKNKGVIWYEHEAFGKRCGALSGLPVFGAGTVEALKAEKGNRSVIASLSSHGTGTDGLQFKFYRQLIANPPASGDKWEQLLGRLHRIGQVADEVESDVYRHTDELAESIDSAVRQAKYIDGTWGALQKLLVADCSFSIDNS